MAFALLWMSCERDAEIPLPESDPKMGLACFLSPGQPIQVYLQRVEPLFSKNPSQNALPILDAKMFFSNGFDTIQLTVKSGEQFYIDTSMSMPIKAGKSYYIWAETPLLPSVFASCTVPKNYIDTFLINYGAGSNGADSTYQISLDWMDIPGENNYYRVRAESIDSLKNGGFDGSSFSFTTHYYSDVGRDAQLIQTGIGSYSSVPGQVRSRHITAQLVTCDVNYFRYHLSIEEVVNGNPFVQPSSLFSNVTGGVGCFGAYIQHTYKMKVF